jgi:SAM-dependent methyltransferase
MPSFDRPTDPDVPPSPWVLRWAHLIPRGGRVLDLAAGHGRHARALAAQGHPVLAVDLDISALGGADNVEPLAADLETGTWPFVGQRFAGIVVTNYLHRPHFPHLVASLEEGGVLLFETFGQGNEKFGRPRNPDFLLAPGELLQAFPDLQVVAYEHGIEFMPRPEHAARMTVRQRLCAIKSGEPVVLG